MSGILAGILYKHKFEPARVEAERLKKWLEDKGISVFMEEIYPKEKTNGCYEDFSCPDELKWAVVLGGDGTLLAASRKVGRHGVPILGVNLGGLGFLTSITLDKLYPSIEMVLSGGLELEERLMLETRVLRDEEEICRFQTLNDVVINKGPLARIIDLDIFINEEFLTTFRSDGLIISTPTGSTGYNLAAGGPVLYPTLSDFIMTPICPFTLTNRPIILPDSETVLIMMGEKSEERVSLTFDGQVGFDLVPGDKILIYKSESKIRLFKSPDQSYFEILRTKMMWGVAAYKQNGEH